MPALEIARVPRCDPARFARVEAGLLARGWPAPLLLVAGLGEPAVLVGRHQRTRSAVDASRARARGLRIVRRAGGGRSLVVGDGTAGVFLYVPPGDPLVPGPLPADRMLNRLVRGLLAGLRAAGARSASYLGRDFISVDARQLAVVSQEGTESGGVALEAFVSVRRPLAVPHEFTRYPASRDPRAAGPRPVTLEEVRGGEIDFDALATALEQGYAAAHDRELARAEGVLPEAALPPAEEDEDDLVESGLVDVPIGFAEALVRHDGGLVCGPRLRGDFLAPAFVIDALEGDLEGAPPSVAEVGRRVDAAFHRPGAFLHGVRDPRTLTDAILAAAARA